MEVTREATGPLLRRNPCRPSLARVSARLHKVVYDLLEKRLMPTREARLDEWLHECPALDGGDVDELVLAVPRPNSQLGSFLDLPSPPHFIAAPDRHPSHGVTTTAGTVLDALKNAWDGDLLSGPSTDTGDDGHALVDDECLQLLAVLEEEGVFDYLVEFHGAPLISVEVWIWRDERFVGLEGGNDGLWGQRGRDWHPIDNGEGLRRRHCAGPGDNDGLGLIGKSQRDEFRRGRALVFVRGFVLAAPTGCRVERCRRSELPRNRWR